MGGNEGEMRCGSLVLSSRSDEMGVSYEAIISTSNQDRTAQRGSPGFFGEPRLNGR